MSLIPRLGGGGIPPTHTTFGRVSNDNFGFVKLDSVGNLVEEGKSTLFRWISYNIPGLLLTEDRPAFVNGYPLCKAPIANSTVDARGNRIGIENDRTCYIPRGEDAWEWVIPDPREQEDAIKSIAGAGGRATRSYTLGFGPKYHMMGPGQFNEDAFVAMDHALALCRKYGVRLVVPLVNQNSPNLYYGDYGLFTKFRGKQPEEFFTDAQLIQDFKDLLKFMLNRRNTVNGIRYGNDSSILGWQTGNELGSWEGQPPPAAWTIEIARFIKSLAPNTMVIDGTMGGHNLKGRVPSEVFESPFVDVISNNYYYGLEDLPRYLADSAYTRGFKKAFVVGEFGLSSTSNLEIVAAAIADNANISGGMIWSLRYHSIYGGFYTHFEKLDFWSYHVPGFAPTRGFTADENTIVTMLRKHALTIQGRSPLEPYPVPSAPGLIKGVTPLALRWIGSAWASHYILSRRNCPQQESVPSQTKGRPSPWRVIAEKVTDNVEWGKTIYSDKTAIKAQSYCYRVQAVSVDGYIERGAALEIGPIQDA
ncbi:hypothetical protein BASA50_007699 [Batrachochytrium salamandrivorans]|uniref:mannan endo-1,4-beta-mannosidase n=1 Tax=Batrachochytrium salamandrivorans TaxID=1357716 RepID=A0ABQ8F7H7_9FUNG|nr:hypothetical protein BASA60_005439 [Batrachochytrium salamandrivorans]KAH6592972.1 hypothetical protein BASA50_007699 [Batrachochytrium salamandrivorans]